MFRPLLACGGPFVLTIGSAAATSTIWNGSVTTNLRNDAVLNLPNAATDTDGTWNFIRLRIGQS